MFPRRRHCLALLASWIATPLLAHPWQEGTPPLDAVQVGAVLDAIRELGTAAAAEGWRVPPEYSDELYAMVFLYAVSAERTGELPDTTRRALVTFDALTQGLILPDGSFNEDKEVFFLFDAIHPDDISAIAARRDDFEGAKALFSGEAQ